MKRIYNAANNVEAHMVVHMLGQAGIEAHVEGEHLQSGVGDLPAGGLAAVVVDDEDAERARKVIDAWEAESPTPKASRMESPRAYILVGGVIGFFVGTTLAGVMYYALADASQRERSADCARIEQLLR